MGFIAAAPRWEEPMGRVRAPIRINGKACWTLFDMGARNTYVVPSVAALLTTSELHQPVRASLGGSVRDIKKTALLEGQLDGRSFSTHARVVDEIGADEEGRPIEILFGALAMLE